MHPGPTRWTRCQRSDPAEPDGGPAWCTQVHGGGTSCRGRGGSGERGPGAAGPGMTRKGGRQSVPWMSLHTSCAGATLQERKPGEYTGNSMVNSELPSLGSSSWHRPEPSSQTPMPPRVPTAREGLSHSSARGGTPHGTRVCAGREGERRWEWLCEPASRAPHPDGTVTEQVSAGLGKLQPPCISQDGGLVTGTGTVRTSWSAPNGSKEDRAFALTPRGHGGSDGGGRSVKCQGPAAGPGCSLSDAHPSKMQRTDICFSSAASVHVCMMDQNECFALITSLHTVFYYKNAIPLPEKCISFLCCVFRDH